MTAFRKSEEYVPAAWEGNVVALVSSIKRETGTTVYLTKRLTRSPHQPPHTECDIAESVLGVCQRDPNAEFWVVNAASHQVIGCARAREEWATLNGYPGHTEVPSAFWRTVDPRSKQTSAGVRSSPNPAHEIGGTFHKEPATPPVSRGLGEWFPREGVKR